MRVIRISNPGMASVRWTCLVLALILFAAGCGKKDEAEPADAVRSRGMVPGAVGTEADSLELESAGMENSSVQRDPLVADDPVLSEPESSREVAAPAASAPRKAVEGYALQLGSFRRPENAQGLAESIRRLGYNPVIEVATLSGLTYHRVFLRGLPDLSTAQDLGEKLRAELGVTYLVRRQS